MATARSPLLPTAVKRIKNELAIMHQNPVDGIFTEISDEDLSLVHALIVGPAGTPYEGGFFYFILHFPYNYPFKPPKVELMTTGNHTVRFNPNLYADGTVCLSILGTWDGPSWKPQLTLTSVLLSIQSIMGEWPYYNEPGYKMKGPPSSEAKNYNEVIVYETIRVAVCDMIEKRYPDSAHLPKYLRDQMNRIFLTKYPFYEKVVNDRIETMNNKTLANPFAGLLGSSVQLDYSTLKTRLTHIKQSISLHH